MSETTVTLERAQEMATYWHNEALRYESLSQRPGQAHTADGHRIMARDAREFAAAYLAFVDYAAVAEQLAAARREVEAAQQRCEWVATALHGDPMFGPGCDEPLVQQVRALQADLATSRAAQEDVRRVEAWIQAGNAPDLPEHSIAGLVNARYGAIVRWEDEETTVATGDSLEALGRALAQEAGDGR